MQFLSRIHALFWRTFFRHKKIWWRTKNDKYKVCWQPATETTNKVDTEQSWQRTKLATNKVDNHQSWQQTKLMENKVDSEQSWWWKIWRWTSWRQTKLTTDKEVAEETCVVNSSAVQTKSTRVSSRAQPEMCQPDFFCNTTKLLGRSYLVGKIEPLLKTSLLSLTALSCLQFYGTILELWVCGIRTSLPIQTWFIICLFDLLHYCDTVRANLG